MEFATAALASLTSAASGVASAAGSALGLGSSAGGSSLGSTALTILQGGVGLMGAMSSIRAGQAQAAAYRMAGADARLQAGNEQIAATEKETSLRKALVASLGERDVAYAASGVDLSFGTPTVARGQAIDEASRAMSTARTASDMRRTQHLAKAAGYDALASDAEAAGSAKAFGGILSTGFDIIKRG